MKSWHMLSPSLGLGKDCQDRALAGLHRTANGPLVLNARSIVALVWFRSCKSALVAVALRLCPELVGRTRLEGYPLGLLDQPGPLSI